MPFRVAEEHPIAGDALTAIKRSATPETLLTCMCMTMFAEAFKLPYGQDILERLLRPKARGAARHTLEFELLAGLHDNLQAPSRYLVEVMSDGLTVRGVEQIPARGPVLITCNHPGIFDAMVVFASLPRTDVKVIARPRNLLDVLPNVRRHIIFVPDDPAGGTATLRESVAPSGRRRPAGDISAREDRTRSAACIRKLRSSWWRNGHRALICWRSIRPA